MRETHIAVIGTGNIGCRHLQSLAGMDRPVRLYAVDTDPASLAKARAALAAVPCAPGVTIEYSTDMDDLPAGLDIAIIATSSLVRLQAAQSLLARCAVRDLILEKFLFPREADYLAAEALFAEKGVSAWVNCTRRTYSGYQRIREEAAEDGGSLAASMIGGEFGLACNGIHFVDTMAFLTADREEFTCDASMLCRELRPCKRPGYVEFAGSLNVRGSLGTVLTLTAMPQNSAPGLFCITTPRRRYIIDEARQKALYAAEESGWNWEEWEFPMIYPSQLTALVMTSLLDTGSCALPAYKEAARVHLPVLRAFLQHYSSLTGKEESTCPIT